MPQSTTMANVLPPTEEEQSAFFEQLKMAHPNAAILSLVERHPHPQPHPSTEKVKRLPPPLTTLYDRKCKGLNKSQLFNACQSAFEAITITTEEAIYLEQSTRLQAQSSVWFEHRKGRLTASKFGQISRTNPTCPSLSLLKDVMQYSQSLSLQHPSLKWGVDHEDTARQQYIELLQQQHELFEYHAVGLTVDPEYPYLGASPDGAVSCTYCGAGLLETKCPYKHRDEHPHHNISDSNFCLHRVAEAVQLKTTHNYYLQIQGQMAICKRDYCDFVCWTVKGMHVERIAFDASVFNEFAHFFQSMVLPELLTHAIQDGEPKKDNNVANSPIYCLCGEGEHGRMVACDNPQCIVEWFHYRCVGITRKPKGKWYCPSCVSDLSVVTYSVLCIHV